MSFYFGLTGPIMKALLSSMYIYDFKTFLYFILWQHFYIEGEIHKHIYTHASEHTQTLMFHTVIKKLLL